MRSFPLGSDFLPKSDGHNDSCGFTRLVGDNLDIDFGHFFILALRSLIGLANEVVLDRRILLTKPPRQPGSVRVAGDPAGALGRRTVRPCRRGRNQP